MNALRVAVLCVVFAAANAGLIGGGVITNLAPAIIPNTLIQTIDTGAVIQKTAETVETKEAAVKSDDSVTVTAAEEAPAVKTSDVELIISPASTNLLSGPAITTSIIRAPLALPAPTIAVSRLAAPIASPLIASVATPLAARLATPLAAPLVTPLAAPLAAPLATGLAAPAVLAANGESTLIAGPSGTIATSKSLGLGLATSPAILPTSGIISRNIITNPGLIATSRLVAAPGLIATNAW